MAFGPGSALYLGKIGWGVIAVGTNTSSSESLSLGRRGRVQEGGVMTFLPPGGMVVGEWLGEHTTSPSLTLSHRPETGEDLPLAYKF